MSIQPFFPRNNKIYKYVNGSRFSIWNIFQRCRYCMIVSRLSKHKLFRKLWEWQMAVVFINILRVNSFVLFVAFLQKWPSIQTKTSWRLIVRYLQKTNFVYGNRFFHECLISMWLLYKLNGYWKYLKILYWFSLPSIFHLAELDIILISIFVR